MNHSIKMIVTDLDDTLLRTDKTISEFTRSVLSKCRNSGIKVAYATGRGESNAHVAPPEMFDGRISMNGAKARVGDMIIYNRPIPHLTVRSFLIACHKRGIKITSESGGWHYSNFTVSDKWPFITNFSIVDFKEHDMDAEKIYSVDLTGKDIDFIKETIPDSLHMVISRDGIMQIMHRDATKSNALRELARYWGIAQTEVVVFGDDLNDIDMLKYAGIGVAMVNALDEVKAVADCLCDSCDNDGVAKWIEGNIIKENQPDYPGKLIINTIEGRESRFIKELSDI